MMPGDHGPWVSPDQSQVAYLMFSQTRVSLHVVSLTSGDTWEVESPAADHGYIVTVTWVTSDTLSVGWMTRDQTSLLFTICSRVKDWTCNIVSTMAEEKNDYHLNNEQHHL